MKNLDPKAIWLLFINSIFGIAISAVGFTFVFTSWSSRDNNGIIILVMLVASIVLVFFSYIWSVLTYNNFKYELTEQGLKKEQGVIFKKYSTIPYNRIQNIDIYRGVIHRMLGLSDLQIQTAGYSAISSRYNMNSEGKLFGLNVQTAEDLRTQLINKTSEKS